ncbi:MAG: Holliday junction branch migration protein RuvA, partial [Mesorhizobium sp.]
MIGKLNGTVDEIEDDHVVLDVGGVGYAVFCPLPTINGSQTGKPATLHIETVVREDMIRLYGFATKTERELFRRLQANVQGVGAKVAMSVISTLSLAEFASAISLENVTAICKTPGVGRKVAERIVAGMKGKLPAGMAAAPGDAPAAPRGKAS